MNDDITTKKNFHCYLSNSDHSYSVKNLTESELCGYCKNHPNLAGQHSFLYVGK